MTEFLLKTFVKDTDYDNNKTRSKVGTLSSFTGIVCNIILFVTKFLIGTFSNSISIVSDAFNNMSDCLSCILSLFGYRLAAKPADKDHPFGHGRIEYLSSLAMAALILIVGLKYLYSSFQQIINPDAVIYSNVTLITLLLSISVKFWMYIFNTKIGKKTNSSAMLATAADSISDCLTTSVTVVGLIASLFTSLPVDGIIGCLVSILLLKSGWGIISDTVDTLLGKPADQETIDEILAVVNKYPVVIGIHDMIIHNYGPGNMLATFHAEVPCDKSIMEIHDDIDNIEKELYEELHILTTIHMDPIETDNELLNKYKALVLNVLNQINPEITMHDFRMVSGETHTNLIFDVLIPHDYHGKTDELKKQIDALIQKDNPNLFTVVTFDMQF